MTSKSGIFLEDNRQIPECNTRAKDYGSCGINLGVCIRAYTSEIKVCVPFSLFLLN